MAFGASDARIERVLSVPYPMISQPPAVREPVLELLHQQVEDLERNRSVIGTPLKIGRRRFERGLGGHSVGHIRVTSPEPIARFLASIGVDNNQRTAASRGSVVFVVSAAGQELFRSETLRGGQPPRQIDVKVPGTTTLDLRVGDAGDGIGWDHADWAEARVVTAGGKVFWLDQLRSGADSRMSRYPFSFVYGGRHSNELLLVWPHRRRSERIDENRTRITTVWTDPETGLRVEWQVVRFSDFPAAEWLLYLENAGAKDTAIAEDVQALNVALEEPLGEVCYRVHRTNGAPSNPTDFEPTVVPLRQGSLLQLGGGGGRSSNRDFPFMKIETAGASWIVAVGWSGQWRSEIHCRKDRRLQVTAGLEHTHFRLHPGERVRSPRILALCWPGDSLESNAQFRQLVYKHYCARHRNRRPLPTLYCNTCFTRGGHWLNECNAENQISLIRAYAPLGLKAVVTDAGWFEGGWPAGAGNWTPRKDAYPAGMGPVAMEAKRAGTTYGLWFEFERVMAGTWLHRNRPEWLLKRGDGPDDLFLLNLALPEARQYMLNIVKGFMDLPGFSAYRQDFNMDPLPFWRHNDPPDRQGITEMKYIEGLYTYWDEIRRLCPDGLRIECSSGGRRIDLETVMHMHVHQKSDFWFHNEVDQGSIWGLSQYLPNNVFMTPINRMDNRSFHSAMAASLCLGWIADAPDFDVNRAKQLVGVYREARPLLIGAWYPLRPYCRDGSQWMASQFHRPDLDRGLILVVPPLKSTATAVDLALNGLDAQATYELHYQIADRKATAKGAELMKHFQAVVPSDDGGERILYRKLAE